jgi:glycosyltransferase involved in cell wall biosynthesis
MKIGVVIVSHNNESFIEDSIDSVKYQTLKDWTAVIVDNGSRDGTFGIIEGLTEDDGRFYYLKQENEGPSSGRKIGFGKLPEDVKYVHFLNGDDVLHPDYLLKMSNYLDVHPKVGLLACQLDEIDIKNKFIGPRRISSYISVFHGFTKDLGKTIYKIPFIAFFSATGQEYSWFVTRDGIIGVDYSLPPCLELMKNYTARSPKMDLLSFEMAYFAVVFWLPDYCYNRFIQSSYLSMSGIRKGKFISFRYKWDNFMSQMVWLKKMVIIAPEYYCFHSTPLRDFKVAIKSFNFFLQKFQAPFFTRALKGFGEGIDDLFFEHSYLPHYAQTIKIRMKV